MIAFLLAARGRFGLIVLFLLFDTAVQIAFKLAGKQLGNGVLNAEWLNAALSSPIVWCAILLYFAVFVLWMMILQQIDLSRAFPLTALTYVTVPSAGVLFFHETLSVIQMTGIALILAGVILAGQTD